MRRVFLWRLSAFGLSRMYFIEKSVLEVSAGSKDWWGYPKICPAFWQPIEPFRRDFFLRRNKLLRSQYGHRTLPSWFYPRLWIGHGRPSILRFPYKSSPSKRSFYFFSYLFLSESVISRADRIKACLPFIGKDHTVLPLGFGPKVDGFFVRFSGGRRSDTSGQRS